MVWSIPHSIWVFKETQNFPQKQALKTSNLFHFYQLQGMVSGIVKNGGTFLFLCPSNGIRELLLGCEKG
jgi:hypothetical protein